MALSIVLGAVTTLALRDHLERVEARAAAPGPVARIVVAAADLERGATLTAYDVAIRELPEAHAPVAAIASVDEVVGRVLASDVLAGEPLTETRLAPPGGPVAALVPEALRALPVTVALPRGTLVPGDRVDLLATYASGQPHTETVLAGVEVIRVVEAPGTERTPAATLLLLVTPEGSERVAFAKAFADLSVAVAPAAAAAAAWASP
ncbi:MAG TPA: Flp pilus assembly protein CpaB [Actinomycetota bacterium]|nr:Flp pilus assembly protein CpaB [Actinomycetota bacterium]